MFLHHAERLSEVYVLLATAAPSAGLRLRRFAREGDARESFRVAGRERALTLGFMASQRNVGLMLAATGGALPDLTWLYFAFSYFPIYLSPLLIQPLARRIIARAQTTPHRHEGQPHD